MSAVSSKLTELSTVELNELERNESKINEFVEKLPEMEYFNIERERLLMQNESLARENLEMKPCIEEKKQLLLEKLDELTRLRMEFDQRSQTFDVLSDAYSPTTLQDRLRVATLESEEESEKIAEVFLKGQLPVDEFIALFMKKRTLSHERRAKEEKLHHQLLELQRSGF